MGPFGERHRRLACEQLEDRAMMAVSASILSGGVLSIIGTAANETISLHSKGTYLQVDGVYTIFNAASVKSIDIDGRGGNDAINLSVTSGDYALATPVTIRGEAGMDTISGMSGLTAWLSGTGNYVYTVGANANLNGFALSWFDAQIRDSALRTLVKQEFADGSLNRADMLATFVQVDKSTRLTSTNFADLKAIVTTTSLFKLDYVQQLSQDVVLGNTANAHYQGQNLGNLAVNSTSTQLAQLVGKWFLGADRPLGTSDWGPTYSYRNVSGQLFAGAPSYNDIRQGGLGDCYFLSSLAETALRTPGIIQSMFIVNGDGTYTVRFYHNGAADYVTVDSALPTDQYGRLVFNGNGALASSTSNVLWASLAEKAYVELAEQGWVRASVGGGSANRYTNISGGYIFEALTEITGRSSTFVYRGANLAISDFTTFVAAWNAGSLMGLASKSTPASASVVGNHAYAVIGYDARTQTITAYNPWGNNNGSNKPGTVTLTWAQVQASFVEFDYTRS